MARKRIFTQVTIIGEKACKAIEDRQQEERGEELKITKKSFGHIINLMFNELLNKK